MSSKEKQSNKKITELECDSCGGTVLLIVKRLKGGFSEASVKDCNICNKSFGLKSIRSLKEVQKCNICELGLLCAQHDKYILNQS